MKTKYYIRKSDYKNIAFNCLYKVKNNTFYVHVSNLTNSWLKNDCYSDRLDKGYPIHLFCKQISEEEAFRYILEH